MGKKENEILILYASQTGNALDAAEQIEREAERRGSATKIQSIDEFNSDCLPDMDNVVFVVSTTGQGNTPDSMKVFWKFLLKKSHGPDWLSRVRHAVFGLGDSSYQKYNFVAKKLDSRLSGLGATPIIDRGFGDDQHPLGYEGALHPWMSSLWDALHLLNPLPSTTEPSPKLRLIFHPSSASIPDVASLDAVENARLMHPSQFSESRTRPGCFLTLVENRRLTKPGHEKNVRHLEFEFLSPPDVDYRAGDVVEILPHQDRSSVDSFIRRCDLDPDSFVEVVPFGSKNSGSRRPIRLRRFVELTMDVASASPGRYFFEVPVRLMMMMVVTMVMVWFQVMSRFAKAEHEKERLHYFASAEGMGDLYEYNRKERRTVLEVLEDFPSVRLPPEWLVRLVPRLRPRPFSISSSPRADPTRIHLTVNVAAWTTPFGRNRFGLCSSWLAGLSPGSDPVACWIRSGSLPYPAPSSPLILVGPGTGCAPFRGFVMDRAGTGSAVGPVAFFFGCRNEDGDFLYKDFWEEHGREGGVLSGGFYAAFSREGPRKVYVQHRVREQGPRLWEMLSRGGASVYVAGSSNGMPSDVRSAFEDVVSLCGGMSRESSVRWLLALDRARRYHVESW